MKPILLVFVSPCILALVETSRYSSVSSRRQFAYGLGGLISSCLPLIENAAGAADEDDVSKLKTGLVALNELVDNWETRTLNCNFAEIDSSLLSTSKKSELLEKATTNALMQKDSTAVRTKCKRDPEIVRLILGLDTKLNKKNGVPAAFAQPGMYQSLENTPTSTLVGADKMIRRLLPLADDFDVYVNAEEEWLKAISTIDSASYASGAADFGAIVSTTTSAAGSTDSKYLDETRRALFKARDALAIILEQVDHA